MIDYLRSIITFKTSSGSNHVIVATQLGQYYGRFSGPVYGKISMFRLQTPDLPELVTGRKAKVCLLKDDGTAFERSTHRVLTVREWNLESINPGHWNISDPKSIRQIHVVLTYALYRDSLLPAWLALEERVINK